MSASLQTPSPAFTKKDHIFAGALVILFFASLLFPNFFAYSPLILGLLGAALYPKSVIQSTKALRPLGLTLATLAIMALLSTLWSEWTGDVFPRAIKVAIIMGLSFLFCCTAFSRSHIFQNKPILSALGIVWVIAALITTIDLFFNFPFYRMVESIPPEQNVGAFETNRNVFALLIFGWLLLYSFFQPENFAHKAIKIIGAAIIILMPLLLLKSANQAIQLSFILGLIALAAFPYKSLMTWRILKGMLVAGTIIAPLIALLLYKIMITHYQVPETHTILTEAAVPQRVEIWSFLSQHILANPILGYGMEATRYTVFDTPQIFWESRTVLHPHNFALQLWIEWGIFGALIGACLCLQLLRALQNNIHTRRDLFLLTTFITGFCTVAFSYGLWQSQLLGTNLFVMALCIAFTKAQSSTYGSSAS